MSGVVAAVTAAAPFIAGAAGAVSLGQTLFGGSGGSKIAIPQAKVPAAPAPTRRTDTGSNVVLGANNVANQRVSGSRTGVTVAPAQADVIGGLGGGSGLTL